MPSIVFFRHGPAVARGTPEIADDDRPLTPEGRTKTREAARGVRTLDLGIDRVLTSPLPRALETAEILAEALGLGPPQKSDLLRPDSSPERLLSLLTEFRAKTPVLVGHEPSLSASISHLIGGGRLLLKKAGLAVVEDRTLRILMTPSLLRALK